MTTKTKNTTAKNTAANTAAAAADQTIDWSVFGKDDGELTSSAEASSQSALETLLNFGGCFKDAKTGEYLLTPVNRTDADIAAYLIGFATARKLAGKSEGMVRTEKAWRKAIIEFRCNPSNDLNFAQFLKESSSIQNLYNKIKRLEKEAKEAGQGEGEGEQEAEAADRSAYDLDAKINALFKDASEHGFTFEAFKIALTNKLTELEQATQKAAKKAA